MTYWYQTSLKTQGDIEATKAKLWMKLKKYVLGNRSFRVQSHYGHFQGSKMGLYCESYRLQVSGSVTFYCTAGYRIVYYKIATTALNNAIQSGSKQ